MRLCDEHHACLRALIEERGLTGWISPDEETAAVQLQDFLTRRVLTPLNFDAFTDANWAVMGNLTGTLMRVGGNPMELSLADCALCHVNELHARTCTGCVLDHHAAFDWMLERAADDAKHKAHHLARAAAG